MAHYARLGINNTVVRVDIIDNNKIKNEGGIEKDALAFEHLFTEFGAGIWVKCSYNTTGGVHKLGGTPFRANYPGGQYDEDNPWYYDSTNDIFCKGRPKDINGLPCSTWSLNTTTGEWEPPITMPDYTRAEIEAGKYYVWNDAIQASKGEQNGWVLI